jgi:murein DD-endopeptidase MepM/ murein hydrolase activator NlpD
MKKLIYYLHFLRLFPYHLPVAWSSIKKVTNPPSGCEADHKNYIQSYYAIDFIVPVETPVYAIAAGRVTLVRDTFSEWGMDIKLAHKANIIIIKHEDGYLSEYVHLQQGSAKVFVGQEVVKGQIIATTGNSGYMDIPHLHFNVFLQDYGSVPSGIVSFIAWIRTKRY